MLRRDITTRAFRGAGVGIDILGQEKSHLKSPACETYKGPDIDGEHNDELLTTNEIKAVAKAETKFQEAKKKRRKEEEEEVKRRANIRINKP